MFCMHGTWVPDEREGFVRQGDFYLWVETDQPPAHHPDAAGSAPAVSTPHPRHLSGEALLAFLAERLGIGTSVSGMSSSHQHSLYVILPSAAGGPLPSHEMLPYVEQVLPEEITSAWWGVEAYRLDS